MITRYAKPTSQNIVYTGSNTMLDPMQEAITANQNKFLKNISGNLSWASLPIPDVSTLTSAQDKFVLTFDYASQSYLLRYLAIPYQATTDAKCIYIFIPTNASTTFSGSTLTKISNLSSTGTSKDCTDIRRGANFTLSGGIGLLTSPSNPAYFVMPGYAPVNNWAIICAFKADFSQGSGFSKVISRTVTFGATDTNNGFLIQYAANSGLTTAGFALNYSGTTVISGNANMTNGSYNIVSIICLGGNTTYLYCNGAQVGSTYSGTAYSNTTDSICILDGPMNTSIDAGQCAFGTTYAYVHMENIASVADVQKVEGWLAWIAQTATLPFLANMNGSWAYKSNQPLA
jgi:hypothetical protein